MQVYANILGQWTDITNTGTIDQRDPITYVKEELGHSKNGTDFKSFEYDYVNIEYAEKTYRIHPSMIQIVK